ncbi:hypothetical protein MNEG_8592 [Monoraphidium neglectum]|uniref:Uncharacterized protein n=1 Tax=Monoraphidium neglectum TaxID=145388 RepID=A0A0D2MYZ0_9CHLO|nr:hypothetical protein MNEG_8592 [Monoraphidium neglectum]KIY99370.1 hypothetical protein MNEG_8592 [Monoraphidium neglectum]|eukprot:XP_013898390.1 hypothetical protein MNEG_8592 [Monoraphidium neglectum]
MRVTSQAMQYDASPSTQLPPCAASLTPDEALPPPSGGAGDSVARQHYGRVIAALLYAHNLVTPLCWGSWTAYGGAPIAGSPAARDAAYVHALIHRQEGSCDGEFGSGWSNANYWYSSASAASHPIAPRLADAARRLAQGDAELEKAAASLTAAGGGGAAGKGGAGGTWDPLRFVGLCARAAEGGDARLLGYCGQLMGREVELLLDHCYEAAAAAAAGRKT